MLEICMTLYNRVGYTMKGINSLHKVINNEIKVNFIDDCSTPMNTGAIKEIIKECGMTNYSYYLNERNLGIERNIFFVPYVTNSEYLFLTDNDIVYSSKFLEQLKKGVGFIGSGNNSIITFFDTPSHKIIDEYDENYNLKQSVGGASLLLKTNTMFNALKYTLKNGYTDSAKTSWDWGMVNYCKENNIKILSTKNSYVQHIGIDGVHSRSNLPNSFDEAKNFIE
jgi:hypothetical protein